jgi:hypothetical protein
MSRCFDVGRNSEWLVAGHSCPHQEFSNPPFCCAPTLYPRTNATHYTIVSHQALAFGVCSGLVSRVVCSFEAHNRRGAVFCTPYTTSNLLFPFCLTARRQELFAEPPQAPPP